MNKAMMIALALAAMSAAPSLAAAPSASYVQVQSTTTPGAAVDNAAAATGAAVDNAAAATGNAVDNAAAATGAAATTAGEAVKDAVDPNKSVDTNNDGVADTRQFPWGLLGLIGLAGLFGRRPTPVVLADTTDRKSVV